ncbi:hypothetical protein N7476_004738, partial [Penicillium atrosanguineum]
RDGRLDIATRLLSTYKVDVNAKYAGYTSLLLAVKQRDLEAVELLLKSDTIDVHCRNISGQTPLLYSVTHGSIAIFERLMRHNMIKINDQDKKGVAPITAALSHNQGVIFQTLLFDPRTNVNIKDWRGQTPLHMAVRMNNNGAIQMLVKHPEVLVNCVDNNGDTPLLLALKHYNHFQAIRNVESLVYGHRVDLHWKDRDGRTAIWYAVDLNDEVLLRMFLKEGNLGQTKVELNEVDEFGTTPLARASQRGYLPTMKILFDQPGICINAPTQFAISPLLAACRAGKKSAVELLLRQGSTNIDQTDLDGNSALQVAINAKQFDIAGILAARRDSTSSDGEFGLFERVLFAEDLDLNLVDDQGRTPLWWAADYGNLKAVKLLCAQKGVKKRTKDVHGITVYVIAKRHGHVDILKFWRAP